MKFAFYLTLNSSWKSHKQFYNPLQKWFVISIDFNIKLPHLENLTKLPSSEFKEYNFEWIIDIINALK